MVDLNILKYLAIGPPDSCRLVDFHCSIDPLRENSPGGVWVSVTWTARVQRALLAVLGQIVDERAFDSGHGVAAGSHPPCDLLDAALGGRVLDRRRLGLHFPTRSISGPLAMADVCIPCPDALLGAQGGITTRLRAQRAHDLVIASEVASALLSGNLRRMRVACAAFCCPYTAKAVIELMFEIHRRCARLGKQLATALCDNSALSALQQASVMADLGLDKSEVGARHYLANVLERQLTDPNDSSPAIPLSPPRGIWGGLADEIHLVLRQITAAVRH